MIPHVLPPGVPVIIENGLFYLKQGECSPLTPAFTFFKAVSNSQLDIGFDGSCPCDILIL